MNSSSDDNELPTRGPEGVQAVAEGTPRIDVRRRNIVLASLASGPLIMTVTARRAGAVSNGIYASGMDQVIPEGEVRGICEHDRPGAPDQFGVFCPK